MAFTGKISLLLSGLLTAAADIESPQSTLADRLDWDFASGTGNNQADQIWSDERTLSASATENLDLAGSLTNALGQTVTFAEVRAIVVEALTGNTNDVLVGGAASNQFAPMFGDVSDIVKVKPGGAFMVVAPKDGQLGVTAGSGDILKIANSAGSTSVTYRITIIGTTA